jgi:cell division septation protein DedD
VVYTNPPTEQVTETVYDQQVATETTTSAVVTGETNLYPQGETLEDSPVYFLNATPDLTVRTVTDVPEGEAVTVSQRVTLRHRASRGGEVFWSTERLLAATEERTTEGSVATESTVDMRAVNRTPSSARRARTPTPETRASTSRCSSTARPTSTPATWRCRNSRSYPRTGQPAGPTPSSTAGSRCCPTTTASRP